MALIAQPGNSTGTRPVQLPCSSVLPPPTRWNPEKTPTSAPATGLLAPIPDPDRERARRLQDDPERRRLRSGNVLESQPAVRRLGNDRGEDALAVDQGHREREAAIGAGGRRRRARDPFRRRDLHVRNGIAGLIDDLAGKRRQGTGILVPRKSDNPRAAGGARRGTTWRPPEIRSGRRPAIRPC